MKILLVCNAGMSTSMLVQKMVTAAKKRNLEVIIDAKPYTVALKELDDWDVVMLGPQVRHVINNLKSTGTSTPIEVIDMRAYGLMDGEKVLDAAIKAINSK